MACVDGCVGVCTLFFGGGRGVGSEDVGMSYLVRAVHEIVSLDSTVITYMTVMILSLLYIIYLLYLAES